MIESRWREAWRRHTLYAFSLDDAKKSAEKPVYILVELPYPSGDLHIGHWFTFIAPDVVARFYRMQGRVVFFPMGFDAFGLPAENAAIKRGINPREWTLSNIQSMTKQFATMGTMIDWDRVTVTCLPEYYRWNQWIFLKLYERGLAYLGKAMSNWCPTDQTVLANEHVENGRCWRCGSEVVQKEVTQWFLKITDYADRLLWKDTDPVQKDINWPASVKSAQNDWIGMKTGMKIRHQVVGSDLTFETFTAYPAWSWADTYIVISPEHPLVTELAKGRPQERDVMEFVRQMASQTQRERKETTEKKGIFTGAYAKDPFGGADMPIYLANFALMEFGTGIVRCSSHDVRDVAFAKLFDIPLKEVVARIDPSTPANAHSDGGILQDSGPFTGREVHDIREEVMDWIEKQGIGVRCTTYHLRDWSISRQRYWGTPVPMIHCRECGIVPVPESELPILLPDLSDITPRGKPPLAGDEAWLSVTCPKCGGHAVRDAETLDTFFDSSWYMYRYVDPTNTSEAFSTRDVRALMPVDIYFGGGEHTVGHTLYARFFTKFFHDLGLVPFEEFAYSRVQHGIVLGPDGAKMSKSKGNVVNPDAVAQEYGSDTVRMYLCFMMPYHATGPWSTEAVYGVYRFLTRVYRLSEQVKHDIMVTKEDRYHEHHTIQRVSEDIKAIQLNTAVAALMEWLNWIEKRAREIGGVHPDILRTLTLLLAPFAPHLAEEIWQTHFSSKDGFSSVHQQSFPTIASDALIRDELTVVIQVNGKVRADIRLSYSDAQNKDTVTSLALADPRVKKWLNSASVKKVVFIKGKLLNLVV